MTDEKPWYKSRTVVAGLVTFLAVVLKTTGLVDLDDTAIQGIVDGILNIITALGPLVAVWYRIKAQTRLTGRSVGKPS